MSKEHCHIHNWLLIRLGYRLGYIQKTKLKKSLPVSTHTHTHMLSGRKESRLGLYIE